VEEQTQGVIPVPTSFEQPYSLHHDIRLSVAAACRYRIVIGQQIPVFVQFSDEDVGFENQAFDR
jgi:hypothetical protein